jgi:hypothetical protein
LTFREKHQMKVTKCSTIAGLFLTCIVACKKSDNPSPANFAGKWELTGYQGTLSSDFAFKRNDTTVEQTEYQTSVSTVSGGYLSFTGNSTSSDSLFVNPQYTEKVAIYQNGVLVSDTTYIFLWPQNTLNVTSEFEIIGSDSIYFNGPGIPLTRGAAAVGSAEGAIFSISGNTMTITSHIYSLDSTSSTSFGRSYQSYVMTLVRQ